MWHLGWERGWESSRGGARGKEARFREERRQGKSLLPAAHSRRRAQAGLPSRGLTPGAGLLSPPDPLSEGSCQSQCFAAYPCTRVTSPGTLSLLYHFTPSPSSPSSQAGPLSSPHSRRPEGQPEGAARGEATCQGLTAHWLQLALHQQVMFFRSLDLRSMQILHST